MKRIGIVIGTVAENLELYRKLHSDSYAGVRHLLKKYNFQNFNIFITEMDDGKQYMFSYSEYVGDDFESDDAELRALPEYAEWLKLTGTCQKPLRGETGWKNMEQIFFLK